MYSRKNRLLKYFFGSHLIFSLSTTIFSISFSNPAFSQSLWLPDKMKCTINGAKDIDFGSISGFEDKVLTATSDVKSSCKSSYFTKDGSNRWNVSGSACVGLTSLQSPYDVTPRYLYLNGDRNSPYKLPYDYYLDMATRGMEVGDGVNTPGGISSFLSILNQSSMPTSPVDADLAFKIVAVYNFHYTDLPVGKYWNQYNINMRTGAGGTLSSAMSVCGVFPNVSPPVKITVMAEIKPSCILSVKRHINFGVHTRLTSNIFAYGELGMRCNTNANYEVLIDGGRNKDTNDRRMSLKLAGGTFDDTKQIGYSIYLPNSHANWGDQKGIDTYKDTGNNSTKTIRIDAKINPKGNFSPAVGDYHDDLVVTVIY